jgi:hypothetical protein
VTTTQLVGLALASVHGAVVVWVVWAILCQPEPAWPQYWNLAAITSMPASLVVLAVTRVACKAFLPRRRQFTVSELERQIEGLPPPVPVGAEQAFAGASVNPSIVKGSVAWERAQDFGNFQLPLLLFGVGGVLWWYFVPQWIVAAYHAAAKL